MISAPARRYDYVTVPAEIYRRSFATIRSEADLSRLPEDMRTIAVRMIHACGDVDLVKDLAFHPRLVSTVRAALAGQAAIFTDTQMLAAGITRRRLPADNDVMCLLGDSRAAELAARWGTTRSAAAVSLVDRAARRHRRGYRQRPNRTVPSIGADCGWRAAARRNHRDSRWLRGIG